MWSNYHTHSTYCDGKSELNEIVEKAVSFKMKSIGFASHGPLPFDCDWCMRAERFTAYLNEIDRLKTNSDIGVYAGLEVDYIPGKVGPSDFTNQLDFTVGSVHFVDSYEGKHWEADNTLPQFEEGLLKVFDNDVKKAVQRYFELIREMLALSTPTILGHMDRIKVHNMHRKFFDEQANWYLTELSDTLELAKQKGVIIEVNTRGLQRKRSREPFPGNFAIQRIAELQIPVHLASDAHHADDLIALFPQVAQEMIQAGITTVVQLADAKWEEVGLKSLQANAG
jgi:histidinol-phosphatase (PHP family)